MAWGQILNLFPSQSNSRHVSPSDTNKHESPKSCKDK